MKMYHSNRNSIIVFLVLSAIVGLGSLIDGSVIMRTNMTHDVFRTKTRVSIDVVDHGFMDIVVGVDPAISEEEYPTLIEDIKQGFREASELISSATKSLAYFKTVRILLPASWISVTDVPDASWERFQTSDFRIAPANENFPYTEKFTGCGLPGRYIALTPDYVVNNKVDGNALHLIYGTPDKVIVHEWGHYRWGLFDEYPKQAAFYEDLETGQVEATRCVRSIPGEIRNVHTGGPCRVDDFTEDGLPDSSRCVFFDDLDAKGYSASIMYKQYLSNNEQFCDDPTIPGVPDGAAHNPMAPNEQNDKCQQRSAWEVLRGHPDFAETNDLDPTPVESTEPEFILVRQRTHTTTVLVLDTSGSMDGERIVLLQQASANIIENVLPIGSRIGIISFAEYAYVRHEIVEIVSDDTRESLIRSLPRQVDGRTSIGRGVQLAVQKLNEQEVDPAGSSLIVITDGEQNSFPYIADVIHLVDNLTVNTIAVGGEADEHLESLAMSTGGDSFSHTDKSSEIYLSFFKAAAAQISLSQVSEAVIDADYTSISVRNTFTNKFHLDHALTGGLTIIIAYIWGLEATDVDFQLIRPDGISYDRYTRPTIHATNSGLRQIKITLDEDRVMAGEWTLNVTNNGMFQDEFSIVIQPRVRAGATPILATAQWAVPTITPPSRQVLYVFVQQGDTPVVNAEVNAVVTLNTQSNTADMVTLQPKDDGIGADVNKDDGIYSAYFTTFLGKGRHGVEIQVSSSDETKLANGALLGYGAASNPAFNTPDRTITFSPTGEFQREITGGSFECTSSEICGNSSVDIYPPGRITDLKASRNNSEEIVLTFTAPGDDLAHGNASLYEIRFSTNFTEISKEFETSERVPSHWFSAGDVMKPKAAGLIEEFVLNFTFTGDTTALIFGIIAIDDMNNRGDRSNLVIIQQEKSSAESEAQKSLSPGEIAGITLTMLICFFAVIVLIVVIVIKRNKAPSKSHCNGGPVSV